MDSLRVADRHRSRPNAWDDLPDADFRVSGSKTNGYRVEILTPRARRWARTNLGCDQHNTTEFSTDLAGANSLIHRAREAGYVSEYAGPVTSVRI